MSDQTPNDLEPALQKVRALTPPRIFVTFTMSCNTVAKPRRLTLGPYLAVSIQTDPFELHAQEQFELDCRTFRVATWTGNGWLICDSMEDSPVYSLVQLRTEKLLPDGPITFPNHNQR